MFSLLFIPKTDASEVLNLGLHAMIGILLGCVVIYIVAFIYYIYNVRCKRKKQHSKEELA